MSRSKQLSPPDSVTRAVDSGAHRDMLVALRDRLWDALNDERTQPRDLSPLCLRLKELQIEIDALDFQERAELDELDDEPFRPEDI